MQIILYSECDVCLAMAGLIVFIRPNKTNSTHVKDPFYSLNLGLGALTCVFYTLDDHDHFVLSLMEVIQLWLPAIGLYV